MKLFVKTKSGKKYLSMTAANRYELLNKIGKLRFNIGTGEVFHINDVIAESESSINGGVGAVIGGIVGSIGGPAGVLIGASLGGIFGSNQNDTEKNNVDSFNKTFVQ